jgi:hypothetical protein
MMSSNKIVIYSLIITAVLISIIVFITKYFTSNKNSREEINFPFRAIWKEMPEYVKQGYRSPMEYTTKSASKPITSDIYYDTLHQQQLSQNINEIYPVTYTRGESIDRIYNVRPSTYGALTLRDTEHPYQDITTDFIRVGTLASVDKTDDTVMTLFRRDISPERDLYEYKVIDKTNGNDLEIYLSTNTTFLRNGDKLTIPGYENKGLFEVNLDSRYRYSRLKPFP